jgi:hypothetical protein
MVFFSGMPSEAAGPVAETRHADVDVGLHRSRLGGRQNHQKPAQ